MEKRTHIRFRFSTRNLNSFKCHENITVSHSPPSILFSHLYCSHHTHVTGTLTGVDTQSPSACCTPSWRSPPPRWPPPGQVQGSTWWCRHSQSLPLNINVTDVSLRWQWWVASNCTVMLINDHETGSYPKKLTWNLAGTLIDHKCI